MTTGPLLGLLRKSLPLIKDEKTRKIAAKFCKDMNSLIEYRNHIMHGMWGWFITDGNPENAKPSCLYMKDPKRELFPDRITTTANRAAEQSHKIYKVVKALYDLPSPDPSDPYPRYFFTKNEQVRTPEGLTLEPL